MLGTNYIDSNSYYNNSLLNVLNLDERIVKQEVTQHIRQIYDFSKINKLSIDVKNNEVLIDILLEYDLPFEIPFKFVTINATSSAKLMLE